MDNEVKIILNDEIEKIMVENLSEKVEEEVIKLDSCENCWYYENPWIHGGELYCCAYNFEDTRSSRNKDELYKNCPINHELHAQISYIKKYGIIHNKPNEYSTKGSINIVDFSDTTFEADGYNPDVYWENVMILFYNNQEEADTMIELALDYYNRFNLDGEYVKKHCFG